MSQTSIGDRSVGIEGDRAEVSPGDLIKSYELVDSTDVPFGRAVRQDAAGDRAAELPGSAGDFIVGFALQDPTIEADTDGTREYSQRDVMSILQRGSAYALPEQAVAPGDPVFFRHAAGGAGQTVGRLRMDADATAGVAPQVSVELAAAELDEGQSRVQTLLFDGDFVTSNVINMTIGGEAIAPVTFSADHGTTMAFLAESIRLALAASNQLALVAVSDPGVDRELTITSLRKPWSATAQEITGVAVTAGASQATGTAADQQAGIAPSSVSITVDGDAMTMDWIGDSDATWMAFADLLASHPKVASAVVLKANDADTTPLITLTGINSAADDIDLAAGAVSGGVGAPTLTINNEVTAGVAAVAAKATQLPGAVWRSTAAQDVLAIVEFNLPA